MTADIERAALKATETLIKHRVSCVPVDPLPILKQTPSVLVLSFKDITAAANFSSFLDGYLE